MPVNSDARVLRDMLSASGKPNDTVFAEATLNAVGNTYAVDCTKGLTSVVMHMKNVGTVSMSAGTWIPEVSLDSTNGTDGLWLPIHVTPNNLGGAPVASITSGTIAANAGHANFLEASVAGVKWFRLRCSVAVTASSSARWVFALSSAPLDTHINTNVMGSVTANEGTPFAPSVTTTNSAASTNATVVKSSAGTLFGISVSNINAAVRYLKLYNKASAPTVGTDVPVLTIPLPAGSCQVLSFGSRGLRFSTGIGFALTTGAADSDTAAVAASEIKVATSYA